MAGVGIERDVAQDADVGQARLDCADGAAHEVLWIERLAPVGVAQPRLCIGEERDHRDRQAGGAFRGPHRFVE
jgi:hypothetical protein